MYIGSNDGNRKVIYGIERKMYKDNIKRKKILPKLDTTRIEDQLQGSIKNFFRA